MLCCRGEPYFMRENLAELHTAEAWKMKEGREVVAGELSKPAKEVRRRGYKPSGKDRPLDLEDDQVPPFTESRSNHLSVLIYIFENYRSTWRTTRCRPWGQI
jgi:hypothetical protein